MVLKTPPSEGLKDVRTRLMPMELSNTGYKIFNKLRQYDRRHGWRGPITNTIKNNNWKKK